MKKTFLIGSLVAFTFFISGCDDNIVLEGSDTNSKNKLECKVNAGFEDQMEGDRFLFTFVDGYATEKEVSIEFDTKDEAKDFYDSISEDSENVLDGKRVYYIQKVKAGEKYTREQVKESMESQNCTCK